MYNTKFRVEAGVVVSGRDIALEGFPAARYNPFVIATQFVVSGRSPFGSTRVIEIEISSQPCAYTTTRELSKKIFPTAAVPAASVPPSLNA